MPARNNAASAWRRCSPSCWKTFREHLRNANTRSRFGRRRRSAASVQIVSSGAKMLRFGRTSSSNSWPMSKFRSCRRCFSNSPGIRSADANRSAGLRERIQRRCSSMSSRMVTRFPTGNIRRSRRRRLEMRVFSLSWERLRRPRRLPLPLSCWGRRKQTSAACARGCASWAGAFKVVSLCRGNGERIGDD
jgi:hypothetical protein